MCDESCLWTTFVGHEKARGHAMKEVERNKGRKLVACFDGIGDSLWL
jgi:hypothetical protein